MKENTEFRFTLYFAQQTGTSAMENRYGKQIKGVISTSLGW